MKEKNNNILIAIIIALAIIIFALVVGIGLVVLFTYNVGKTSVEKIESQTIITEDDTIEVTTTEEPTTPTLDMSQFTTGIYTEDGQTDESVLYDGGVKVEITSLSENTVSFTYTAISSPPANRISEVVVSDAEIVDGKASFTFDDDGWFNRGKGYIQFLQDGQIEIKTKITRRDEMAMWDIGELKHTLTLAQ